MEEVRHTYRNHLKRDFPADELKPLAAIERSLRHDRYKCLGIYDGDGLAGYAFFVYAEKYCLLDYYAVLPDMRGRGIGTLFLRMLGDDLKKSGFEIVIIEIDHPKYAGNSDELEEQTRRKDFYIRAGMADTGVEALVFGVRFLLLEYPVAGIHTPGEISNAYDTIYRSILPGLLYKHNIKIQT